MAKLVIVESPAKAKTIGKYLGDDYEVTASMGHIRDLPASQLGIDVEHGYRPTVHQHQRQGKAHQGIEEQGQTRRRRAAGNRPGP